MGGGAGAWTAAETCWVLGCRRMLYDCSHAHSVHEMPRRYGKVHAGKERPVGTRSMQHTLARCERPYSCAMRVAASSSMAAQHETSSVRPTGAEQHPPLTLSPYTALVSTTSFS